jgi:hypothetical protein
MRYIGLVVLLIGVLGVESASAISFGVAGFGGPSWPIVQDDNGTGGVYGVRVPVNLIPMVTVEPFYSHGSYGDVTDVVAGYTRSGFSINTFGVNLALGGAGLIPGFYPFAGIGSYSLSRDGSADETDVGYNFGVGFGLGLPVVGLSLDFRGEFVMIDVGDTSRKFINAVAAVGYGFHGLP